MNRLLIVINTPADATAEQRKEFEAAIVAALNNESDLSIMATRPGWTVSVIPKLGFPVSNCEKSPPTL